MKTNLNFYLHNCFISSRISLSLSGEQKKCKPHISYFSSDLNCTIGFAFCFNSSKNSSFQAYITTALYKGNPNDPTENWNTEAQFVGKSFYISGVYSVFTGGVRPRYQIVFTDVSTQLLCTEYYNADGSLK